MNMGLRLKIKRIELGFRQKELAIKSGVTSQCLSNIERGITKNPNMHVMKKLSGILGISVQELFFQD